ncbi:prepilin-type N-terminal cleavage/methylation domain-containing protein [Dielma fastidiosa]|uniref:prepilin-type N-terminal cleavage/methylation domain-containing protein n=1 Tax=Dielma fastidiosa TaxID=1034346 RepID=UPI0015FB21B7|nr:prepilin-type N-terminal cleavage/methylation domain-containing protein [Dielma fastidiosa]
MRKKDGFTLIELIVVIAILGILALFLVPSFIGYAQDAKKAVCDSNLTSINRAYQTKLIRLGSDENYDLLNEVLNNTNEEYFSTVPKCPDGGSYLIESYTTDAGKTAYRTKCTIHSKTTSTIPVQIFDQMKDLMDNPDKYKQFNPYGSDKNINDWQLNSNDQVRAILKKANGGKWPTLILDGSDTVYYVQPYMDTYKSETTTPSGQKYVYASTGENWFASLIYDRDSGKWYQPSTKNQTILIANKSYDTVKEEMEKLHWVEANPVISGEIIMP